MNLAKRIPTPNMVISNWLINPTPDFMIALKRFMIVVDFNHIDRYFKRYEEIAYEVSEDMFYYP